MDDKMESKDRNRKSKLIKITIAVLVFALLVFDLWYFVLWPRYGWYPFRNLKASDVLSATIICTPYSREAELTDDEIELLVEELKKIHVYPPQSEYQSLDGGRYLQFKVVFKKWVWEDIWLSTYGKHFWIDWVPYFRAEDWIALDHGFDELYSELYRKYFPNP